MQRSSKAVQSNFRANMRAIKDGRITQKDIFKDFLFDTARFTLAVPIVVGAALYLWLLVNYPIIALLIIAVALFARRR